MFEARPITQNPVKVRFDQFSGVVSRLPKMKRAPRGAKGNIPTDTLLLANSAGIGVETPAFSSVVRTNLPWSVNLSVDARRLSDACSNFKAHGADADEMEIWVADRALWLRCGGIALTLPATAAAVP